MFSAGKVCSCWKLSLQTGTKIRKHFLKLCFGAFDEELDFFTGSILHNKLAQKSNTLCSKGEGEGGKKNDLKVLIPNSGNYDLHNIIWPLSQYNDYHDYVPPW